MLIDKEVCQNPEIENQTARFVEQKFGVNVDDVLIRSLDSILSTARYSPIPKSNFERSPQEILTKINAAVSERFVIKETTVIHLARRGLYEQTGPRHIQTRAEQSTCSCLFLGK
jgi:uncharacterized protein (DUF1697 family)